MKAFQRNSGDYLFQFKIGLKESEDDTFSQFHQASRSYGLVQRLVKRTKISRYSYNNWEMTLLVSAFS